MTAFDIDPAEVDIFIEVREALRDIRVLLLDGLDEPDPQRDHLREIARVMTRPTIARFTRGQDVQG